MTITESIKHLYENLHDSLPKNKQKQFLMFITVLEESFGILENLGLVNELKEKLKESGIVLEALNK